MNELKAVLDSQLKDIAFSSKMKKEVLEICRQSQNVDRRIRPFSSRTLVPVTLFFVLCITIVVAVKGLQCNELVQKRESSERVGQKESLYNDLVETVNVSDQDSGITITVTQTVAISNRLEIYLKVQAKNAKMAKQLVDMFPETEVTFEHLEFKGIEYDVTSYTEEDNSLICKMYAMVGETENEFDGEKIFLKLQDFSSEIEGQDDVIEGQWNLSWTIHSKEQGQQKRCIQFDKNYNNYGKTFKVQKIILSPTTVWVYLNRKSLDKEELWSALLYGTKKRDSQEGKVDGTHDEYIDENFYTFEWRICGIPVSVYNNWTDEERKYKVYLAQNGIYEGSYINTAEWCQKEGHKLIFPWHVTDIRMTNGTSFCEMEEQIGSEEEEKEDCYVTSSIYSGYLMIKDVESIRVGNCVIPLKDGIEE